MAEKRAPRVYVNRRLAAGAEVELEAGQAHHLRSVLRLGRGASVSAFNAADGEWLCLIAEAGKSGMRLSIEHRLREAGPETDLWLLFAPIKRTRVDWLVEKATELGVSLFLPIWTARTQVERVNLVRLQAHAVAAAEQSERLSVPEIKAPERLDRVLTDWPAGRTLLLCDESRSGEPIGEAAAWVPLGPAAILIGPEGGFDQTELDAIGKLSFVTRIGLGPPGVARRNRSSRCGSSISGRGRRLASRPHRSIAFAESMIKRLLSRAAATLPLEFHRA